ncbi:hypothetical protein MIMGU_mgv1a005420mg [Erythranthe guttata]|uniref:HECT-type E3 ubiquitin transferase E3D n=1 Tax=Erythranthe guttata TaxID=4155 RepID=A0A022QXC8_ERYGU|nr:hypothetical protein MIMGU_mgv1a005420mg [Erythranthe guttata]
MSPPSSDNKPPSAAVVNPSGWRFSWEAQSHTPILRLLLFNPDLNPSAQCRDLKLSLLPQQSQLTASFLENESRIQQLVRVPVPRVLIDPESPLHFRVFDDHIEVKLVLLLPVDHPLVSDFDSILSNEENKDELRPLSSDSDLKKLSCMKEIHFYCRNCSSKLTKDLRYVKDMPSVNWADVADNWFGNCCCSFGGVTEKLVADYAKSYTCAPGVCLLSTSSVLLCKSDILGCEFPDLQPKKNSEADLNSPREKCSNELSASPAVGMREGNVVLENQKVFLDGYLGDGFMVRSSGLSKDIQWIEYLCPECSSLVGAYPCFDDNVPLDGGVRLFKCYISTCLPSNGSDDAFQNYTLEKIFASQLLESARDELSFRTIVRDMQTKSPLLQIVLLNPNSWGCAGSLHPTGPSPQLILYPIIKTLFTSASHGMELDLRTLDDWVRKNQADEIYMFSSQIVELIRVLELANTLSPPACTSLQGLFLSSMRR